MILRLRHAVPWLQKFGGWSACTSAPPLVRRFSGTAWTNTTFVHSAAENEGQVDSGSNPLSGGAAEAGMDRKKRRTSRGSKVSALMEAEGAMAKASTAAVVAASAGDAEEGGSAAGSSSHGSASKRRTASRRKTASGGAAEELRPPGAAAEPDTTPKRTRRKKNEVKEEEGFSPTNLHTKDEAQARRSSGAEATSSSSSGDTATGTSKKRASRSTSKKAAAAVKASGDEDDSKDEERASIQSLPYEEFLVLPRKAENILVALGLRAPLDETAAVASNPQPASARGSSVSSVLELASYLQRPHPKEMAASLLIAQYQGYLGPSPDYLYDLFYLDYDPPYLASDVVKNAAVAAARAVSRASSLLSAKGTPPEAVARAAMSHLQTEVGAAAVAAQEAMAAKLTEAQLELFLLDWASARLAGLKGEGGISYLARRCAALQLTRPIVVERLYRYTVQGHSLQALAVSGGKSVRLSQPMEALLEGLKAGVRMDAERLLQDFRLTSPGAPLGEHLDEVRRAVVHEAARSLEAGGSMYYSSLVEKLHVHPEIKAALRRQEAQWQKEQGERDGSTLTHAQVRLLFHLWRLERFRSEGQKRTTPPEMQAERPA